MYANKLENLEKMDEFLGKKTLKKKTRKLEQTKNRHTSKIFQVQFQATAIKQMLE